MAKTANPPQLESSSVPAKTDLPPVAGAEGPAPGPEPAITPAPAGGGAFAPAPAPGGLVDIAHSCHTEQIGDLMAALARAQVRLRGALKDAANPHLRNKYADLSSIWNAWQEVGPAEGLALMQPAEASAGFVTVHTHLGHASGQWVRSTLKLPWEPQKGITPAQAIGSALTYARRYALAALVGVCPEDDDGNAAGNTEGRAPAGEAAKNGNGNGVSKHPAVERQRAKLATGGEETAAAPDPQLELRKVKSDVWGLICKLVGVFEQTEDGTVLDEDATKKRAAAYLTIANDPTYPGGRVAVDKDGLADLSASTLPQLKALRAWLQSELLQQGETIRKDPF